MMFIKIIAIFYTLGIILFIHEIKHAKEVDPKEPFLWDDLKEK